MRQRLKEGGLSPEHSHLVDEVIQEVLMQQHRFYMSYIRQEGEKKRKLQSYIQTLEVMPEPEEVSLNAISTLCTMLQRKALLGL